MYPARSKHFVSRLVLCEHRNSVSWLSKLKIHKSDDVQVDVCALGVGAISDMYSGCTKCELQGAHKRMCCAEQCTNPQALYHLLLTSVEGRLGGPRHCSQHDRLQGGYTPTMFPWTGNSVLGLGTLGRPRLRLAWRSRS